MSNQIIQFENVEKWLNAAATGDIETLQKHLNSGFDIDYKAPYEIEFTEKFGYQLTAPALVIASRHGQIEAVQFLLDHNANIDNKNRFPLNYHSAILAAVKFEHFEIAKFLARRGAKSECEGFQGTTHPLVACASTQPADRFSASHMETIRVLLECGHHPDGSDEYGRSPLHWALMHKNAELLTLLLEHGADVNFRPYDTAESPLDYAARISKLEIVELFLRKGGRMQDDRGEYTVLHHASIGGNLELIQMLLDRGCIAEASKHDGDTALHGAASNAVKLLVQNGFDLEARSHSHKGQTPLLYAVQNCETETAETLLDLGANIQACDDKGDTVLHYIGYYIHDTYLPYADLLRRLISRGANVNASNHLGASPLHTTMGVTGGLDGRYLGQESIIDLRKACPRPVTEGIELLLKAGANIHSRDSNDRTILHAAVFEKNIEVIELLLAAGADVAAKSKDGCTPLFEAVNTSLRPMVEWPSVIAINKVIEFGADVNAKDYQGRTALHYLVLGADSLDNWDNRKTALCLFSNGINIGLRDSRGESAKDQAEALRKMDWVEFLASHDPAKQDT